MPKISIIVPVYNVEKYIEKCIISLIEQTMKDIEIILVNDGSTDNSLKICQKYAQKDKRILLIDKQNTGVSDTRNVGIERANGEYIMFVDSDDWIENLACEISYNEAKEQDADSVIFGYYRESSKGTTIKNIFEEEKIVFNKREIYDEILVPTLGLIDEKLRRPQRLDTLVPIYAKLYKTDIIKNKNIRYMNLSKIPSECLLFNFDYYLNSSKVVYIKKYLYHYRRNNFTSITKGYRDNLFEKWIYWIDYMKKREELSDEILQKALYSRICFSIIPLSGNAIKKEKITELYKEMKKILNHEYYIEAYKQLEFNYFPIHWKIYFKLAKNRRIFLFCIMSKLMRMIIERKKR